MEEINSIIKPIVAKIINKNSDLINTNGKVGITFRGNYYHAIYGKTEPKHKKAYSHLHTSLYPEMEKALEPIDILLRDVTIITHLFKQVIAKAKTVGDIFYLINVFDFEPLNRSVCMDYNLANELTYSPEVYEWFREKNKKQLDTLKRYKLTRMLIS